MTKSASSKAAKSLRLDLHNWRLGEALPVRRWYRILEPGTLDIGEREAARRFGDLLTDSVRLHLRSDVPVGTCLSGGLDSSSIVCLMARDLAAGGNGAQPHSVSACYDAKQVDERPFMETVVEWTDSTPHWCYPSCDDAFAQAERYLAPGRAIRKHQHLRAMVRFRRGTPCRAEGHA